MRTQPADPTTGARRMERHQMVTGGWVILTSPIEGYATAQLARRLRSRDHHGATNWAAVAVVSYVMPDAYVFDAARQMPGRVGSGRVFIVVLSIAVVLAMISLVLITRSVRSREPCPPDDSTTAVPDVQPPTSQSCRTPSGHDQGAAAGLQ